MSFYSVYCSINDANRLSKEAKCLNCHTLKANAGMQHTTAPHQRRNKTSVNACDTMNSSKVVFVYLCLVPNVKAINRIIDLLIARIAGLGLLTLQRRN